MSPSVIIGKALLADASRVAEMGQKFQDPTTTTANVLFYMCISALLLALLAGVCWMIRRWQFRWEQRIVVQRWRLFRELCQIHELSRSEVTNLRRLIKVLKMENPAMLFVKPDCFEVERPSQFFTNEAWLAMQQLRDRLFARRIERKSLK